ncbi:ParB/RepB/Spo0J family partition protein [Epibacterium ulvae]|uniref:ParB/RepB/Spo0J family partition protein n=1 Tax=Epibacterium ulvae TaxID=1156985 RepID=UPI0024922F3C|nr:ParB/RepB/Spo0J family partition protein [Epibacterium ulvae]
MELTFIDLEQLTPSRRNVRKHGAKDVQDLTASIAGLGLLQPLLVQPFEEGFEVIAGQRRYHALCALAEEATPDPVPCVVM